MKKLLLIGLFLLLSTSCFAEYQQQNATLHRSVTSADTTIPPAGITFIDAHHQENLIVEAIATGASQAWTITPMFLTADGTTYASGTSVTVNYPGVYVVPVYGYSNMYIRVASGSTVNTTLNIYVKPTTLFNQEFRGL